MITPCNEFTAMQLYVQTDSYFKDEWWFACKRWAEDHGFLELPASIRHHGAYDGGLLVHSMNVLKCLWQLDQAWETGYSKKALIIAATWHDIGKMGILCANGNLIPRYITEEKARPFNWKWNSDMPEQDLTLASVLILRRFVILPFYIEEAIEFHDGPYPPGQLEKRQHKQGQLELMLHYADYWSGHVLEQGLGDRSMYDK